MVVTSIFVCNWTRQPENKPLWPELKVMGIRHILWCSCAKWPFRLMLPLPIFLALIGLWICVVFFNFTLVSAIYLEDYCCLTITVALYLAQCKLILIYFSAVNEFITGCHFCRIQSKSNKFTIRNARRRIICYLSHAKGPWGGSQSDIKHTVSADSENKPFLS